MERKTILMLKLFRHYLTAILDSDRACVYEVTPPIRPSSGIRRYESAALLCPEDFASSFPPLASRTF